jgi:chaperonin cofactor prefoldin
MQKLSKEKLAEIKGALEIISKLADKQKDPFVGAVVIIGGICIQQEEYIYELEERIATLEYKVAVLEQDKNL